MNRYALKTMSSPSVRVPARTWRVPRYYIAAVPIPIRVVMTSALFTLVRVSLRFACRLCCALQLELLHLPIFAPKGGHHADGAQAFLRLGSIALSCSWIEVDSRPDAVSEEINGGDNRWDDA